MARISKRRIARVVATARHNFGLDLPSAVARKIIKWDDDELFVKELSDNGELDTAPLDYFSMALLAQLMPGKPFVQDELISHPLERWHFPLIASSAEYCKAFNKEWRNATKHLMVKP